MYQEKRNRTADAAATEMPAEVQRRLQALQKLQIETYDVEADFHKKVFDIECEYQKKHADIYRKRQAIIAGDHEPSETECEMVDTINLLQGLKLTSLAEASQSDIKGIPNFWLTILKTDSILGQLVQESDEHALAYLCDIRCQSKSTPNLSFVLEFHFAPNEYFHNEILTKEYLLQCKVDTEDPFDFDGPEIYKSIGCTIDWKDGKDLTQIDVNAGGEADDQGKGSFFQFFRSVSLPVDSEEGAAHNAMINTTTSLDFEIGLFLKEKIIPSAVLYYLEEKATAFEVEEFSGNEEDTYEDEIVLTE